MPWLKTSFSLGVDARSVSENTGALADNALPQRALILKTFRRNPMIRLNTLPPQPHEFGLRLVRAVAVACWCSVGFPQAQTRYSYSANRAEVTDAKNGLIWRRCSEVLKKRPASWHRFSRKLPNSIISDPAGRTRTPRRRNLSRA
jgi:hypothetical protein